MKTSIVTLFLLFAGISFAGEWISDPSMQSIIADKNHSVERYRILCDFNADGVQDLALSTSISLFGNAGGLFTLYLGNTNGLHYRYGHFFAKPLAIAVEHLEGQAPRIWKYSRGGGWIGQLGYHEILDSGLSDYYAITIYPGDGGTKMGNALFDAMVANTDAPLIVQRSKTENEKVEWYMYPNK